MILEQKQTHRSMEPNSPVINSHSYGQLIYDKGTKIYNEAKITSSINGIGETGQLHVKESN